MPLQKSKSVSRSNWAAPKLTPHQLKYAALDVFAAGQLMRGLRLWHSSPSPCAACHQPFGALLGTGCGAGGALELVCGGCAMKFGGLDGYVQHCAHSGHPAQYGVCEACGRVRPL